MKNIHILPTCKLYSPSRLFYKEQELVFTKKYEVFNGVHIYITSDEEIKQGDYYMRIDTSLLFKSLKGSNPNIIEKYCKKIILTTDQDLIADGVQAIDDEFLEWFVKNPTCEEVKVKRTVNDYWKKLQLHYEFKYKIIIPQEELKQETLEEVAEKMYPLKGELEIHFYMVRRLAFIDGAKWQQERMYSEEDLRRAYTVGKHGGVNQTYYDFDEWFEKFKKK